MAGLGPVERRRPLGCLRRWVDASGALGAGPGASEVAGGPRRCRREGHGTMMQLGQCWGVGAHFAPRRSEIHVFPLEIKVPTRPGLERLIGHSQCPRSGESEGPGRAKGLQKEASMGQQSPFLGDSCKTGGRG